MNTFQEIPASKMSISKRKLVYGTAINDANYMVRVVVDGKNAICPFYRKWHSMITRCYSSKFQDRYPSYKGVIVCSDWLIFSKFKQWMARQEWQGKQLDKDILSQGNKTYSPEFCIFVYGEVNKLLTNRRLDRGEYPQGVYFSDVDNKYKAQCNIKGKQRHLGFFDKVGDAAEAYNKHKYKEIKRVANKQSCLKLRGALLSYIIEAN